MRSFLLKKNALRTVVNKCDQINTQYRFFEFELLAGEPEYIATVNENGFKYKVDFSKVAPVFFFFIFGFAKHLILQVFWNSRLGNEHQRVVAKLIDCEHKCVLFDVFAGVGPFVIPASCAKNVLKIYANDLNPVAVDYLRENIKLNKVR